MFVSKRLLILSLGLLITLSGCSGNRLRQIFAPDREFMTLSELDEYDSTRGSKKSSTSMAFLSREEEDAGNPDEDDDGFFSVSRWLKPKSTESFAEDPFLETDGNPVKTAGLSEDVTADTAEELISRDEETPSLDLPWLADAKEEVPDKRKKSPTFADIMAEFKDETTDDAADPDGVEAMEQKWLASQAGESEADFGDVIEEAVAEFSPGTPEANETPTLNFDETDESTSAEDGTVPYLDPPISDSEPLTIADLDLDASTETTAGTITAIDDPLDDRPLDLPEPEPESDFVDDIAVDESLWQSSVGAVSWKTDRPDEPADQSDPTAASDAMGSWDFSSATEQPKSDLQFPIEIPSAESLAYSGTHDRQSADRTTGPWTTPAGSESLHDDPFLNDFEDQAVVPAASNVPPEAAAAKSSVSRVGNLSARTWMMLLGAVVIAYLLFAPEQKNLRIGNNR